MKFQKGHKLGRGAKGRSGRKSKAVEFKVVLEKEREKITNEILAGKAKDITVAVLDDIKDTGVVSLDTMSRVVVPIVTKSMPNKIAGDDKNPLKIILENYADSKNKTPGQAEGIPKIG